MPRSLEEVNASVETRKKGFFRKLFAFMGPAYLISVGYMDPGNWATDIAGGSRYGYALIWVLLMSNLMALLLQSLSSRLGIVSGRDLAQASKETYGRATNMVLYLLAEIAIAATDLAEVLGMAIGLQLLFGLPLLYGVLLTFLDTIILLLLIHRGMRIMEAFIVGLIGIIGLAFLVEMFFAQPQIGPLAAGFIPRIPDESALYIAIGIIGATVMPHNLYLHSSLVQSRKFDPGLSAIKGALRFNFIDSAIALNMAFFVNAAILILAAATFYRAGMYEVSEIQDAHRFLQPLLGSKLAPIFFAVALIAAGQSSTLTGTLAGQVVMEGYLNLRIHPWIRRLITRTLAIIPAVVAIVILGEQVTGELLILSQVILSLQLGFAIIPLIHFVSDRRRMGKLAIGPAIKILSWLAALIIVGLNVKLAIDEISSWITTSRSPIMLWLTIVPVALGAGALLLYVALAPLVQSFLQEPRTRLHSSPGVISFPPPKQFKKIAVAIDFSDIDEQTLQYALSLGTPETTYLLIHVVESAGALLLGDEIRDKEAGDDAERLQYYARELAGRGIKVETFLGFGNPKRSIPRAVNEFGAGLLVLGAHGHRFFKDLIFGTTVDSVRHNVNIPVFIVREG
ncbi:MAG: Nramp family divalent metal transporter [Lewinellaceae bacterium]|nr:Nramp family divalent metal transporter [Lewinellaceae bacterium]MCB9291243.1 Nramp family divalent metal transporter [Lewinellaceae bacterium]